MGRIFFNWAMCGAQTQVPIPCFVEWSDRLLLLITIFEKESAVEITY